MSAYIVGRFAQWAGDVEYAAAQFAEVAPGREYGSMPEAVGGPVEVMRYCAALRRRQIAQRKGAFNKIAHYYARERLELSYEPVVIEGRHLRGALWHVDQRRLQLRAFVLSQQFAEHVLMRADNRIRELNGVHEPDADGGTWVAQTDPYVACVVSDSCLIQADALWTRRGEADLLALKSALQGVFESLDT